MKNTSLKCTANHENEVWQCDNCGRIYKGNLVPVLGIKGNPIETVDNPYLAALECCHQIEKIEIFCLTNDEFTLIKLLPKWVNYIYVQTNTIVLFETKPVESSSTGWENKTREYMSVYRDVFKNLNIGETYKISELLKAEVIK